MLLIFESLIVGFISLIIGNLMMYYTSNKEEFEKKKKLIPKYSIVFVLIGVCIHLTLEHFSFNKIYCDKACRTALKNFHEFKLL